LYSRGWVDPVPDPLLLRKSSSAGNRTRTSGSVARNSVIKAVRVSFSIPRWNGTWEVQRQSLWTGHKVFTGDEWTWLFDRSHGPAFRCGEWKGMINPI
jgi:hypothetical protein